MIQSLGFVLASLILQPVSEDFLADYKKAVEANEKSPEIKDVASAYTDIHQKLAADLKTKFDDYLKILETRNDLGGESLVDLSTEMLFFASRSSLNYKHRGAIVRVITQRMNDADPEIRKEFGMSSMMLTFSRILSSVDGQDAIDSVKNLRAVIADWKKPDANGLEDVFGALQADLAEIVVCTLDVPWKDPQKMRSYCSRFYTYVDPKNKGIRLSDIKAFSKKIDKEQDQIAPDAKAFSLWMMELIQSGAESRSMGIGSLLKLQDEVIALLDYMDTDKSDRVSNEEAQTFFISVFFKKDPNSDEPVWLTAAMIDSNQDGLVSEAEFAAQYPQAKEMPILLQRALKKRFTVVPEPQHP